MRQNAECRRAPTLQISEQYLLFTAWNKGGLWSNCTFWVCERAFGCKGGVIVTGTFQIQALPELAWMQSVLKFKLHISFIKTWLIGHKKHKQGSKVQHKDFSLSWLPPVPYMVTIGIVMHIGAVGFFRLFFRFFSASFCAPQIFSQIFTEIFAQR